MSKMFREKSWNEKTELERFESIVDWTHELLWGTPRRPEKKFEGMMMEKPPKRARGSKGRYKGDDKSTRDVNEAWEGGKAPKKKSFGYKKGDLYKGKKDGKI